MKAGCAATSCRLFDCLDRQAIRSLDFTPMMMLPGCLAGPAAVGLNGRLLRAFWKLEWTGEPRYE